MRRVMKAPAAMRMPQRMVQNRLPAAAAPVASHQWSPLATQRRAFATATVPRLNAGSAQQQSPPKPMPTPEELRARIESNAEDGEALVGLAIHLLKSKGDREEIISLLTRGLQLASVGEMLGKLFVEAARNSEVAAVIDECYERDNRVAKFFGVYAVLERVVFGNPTRSAELLKRLVNLEPENASARADYADVLALTKVSDEAMVQYEHAILMDPGNTTTKGRFAEFLSTRDPKRATELFEAAAGAVPDEKTALKQAIVHLSYATHLLGQDDTDGANKQLKRAAELAPNNAQVCVRYAEFLANVSGDLEEAGEYFNRAIRADSKNPDVAYRFANFLAVNLKDLESATQVVDSILKDQPNFAPASQLRCRLYANEGNLEKAVETAKKTAAMDPQNPEYADDLGDMYVGSGQFEEAAAAFQKAFVADPNNTDRYAKVAMALQHAGKIEEAADAAAAGLALDQNDKSATKLLLVTKVSTFVTLERIEEASKAARELVELTPNDPSERLGYSLFLAQTLKLQTESVEEINKALELDPNSAENHRLAAGIAANYLNNATLALEMLEKAVKLEPTNAHVHMNMGQLQFLQLDNRVAAAESFARAYELDGEDEVISQQYAAFLDGTGEKAKAEEVRAKAAAAAPATDNKSE